METTVGIIGDGQLGRMIIQSDKKRQYNFVVAGVEDPTGAQSPAAQAREDVVQIYGKSLYDPDAIRRLAGSCDVMTWEVEHVGVQTLLELAEEGYPIHPFPSSLATINDKLRQKQHFEANGLAVAPYVAIDSEDDFGDALQTFGNIIVKARTGGFDGRANRVIKPGEGWGDVTDFFTDAKTGKQPKLYAEKMIPFLRELAVIGARDLENDTVTYPVVRTVHKDNICHTVYAPAGVWPTVEDDARSLAVKGLETFGGAGIFAFEMFETLEGKLLINEVAPRVHNSGHFSIIGSETSQFAQHLRAITGQKLGSTAMTAEAAVMINVLGTREGALDAAAIRQQFEGVPGLEVNLYGKTLRPKRKVGHVTALGNTSEEAFARASAARELINA